MSGDKHALDELREDIAGRRDEFEKQRLMIERQRTEFEGMRAEAAAQLELQQALERDLAEREQALAARHVEIQTAIKRFERLGIVEERVAQMDELAKQFQARRRYLDDAESLLQQQETELQANRERLENERLEFDANMQRERQKSLEDQKRNSAELARQRESLQRRTEHLDSREAALEQLRAEVNRGQRETLETRLATEELWAQMAGPLAPASLARSLAQVRAKLAEHYRFTDRELAERRSELESLRRALDEKHTQLQQRWHELEDWAERQRHDVEEQASRLVAREQELDQQQSYFAEMELRWQSERTGYRQDIRQLLGKLRTVVPGIEAHLSDSEPRAAVA
jgi:DNA repair exonuclease SbcCD ATPase subunit